jgi:hypothetical protein
VSFENFNALQCVLVGQVALPEIPGDVVDRDVRCANPYLVIDLVPQP